MVTKMRNDKHGMTNLESNLVLEAGQYPGGYPSNFTCSTKYKDRMASQFPICLQFLKTFPQDIFDGEFCARVSD